MVRWRENSAQAAGDMREVTVLPPLSLSRKLACHSLPCVEELDCCRYAPKIVITTLAGEELHALAALPVHTKVRDLMFLVQERAWRVGKACGVSLVLESKVLMPSQTLGELNLMEDSNICAVMREVPNEEEVFAYRRLRRRCAQVFDIMSVRSVALMLRSSLPDIRLMAVRDLAMAGEDAAPYLHDIALLLDDWAVPVRREGLQTLRALGAWAAPVASIVGAKMSQASAEQRAQSLKVLEAMGVEALTSQLEVVGQRIADPDRGVVHLSVKLVRRVGGIAALNVATAMCRHRLPAVRERCIAIIEEVCLPMAISQDRAEVSCLIELLADLDPTVQYRAMLALKRLRVPLSAFQDTALELSVEPRTRALRKLATDIVVGTLTCEEVSDYAVSRLRDHSQHVRRRAVNLLSTVYKQMGHGHPSQLHQLAALVKEDSDSCLRRLAMEALEPFNVEAQCAYGILV
mmetsp:Transcript_7809/g.17148  ORF Transcript_7809/g.17148 Transcript_7809/m.17148 type:complete len:461 (+) Transcript_7809:36-1418(+)